MTPQPPSLWLLRHAQPLIASGVCYGQLDIPADADATQTAAKIFASQFQHPACLRHSPLQRCELLALTLQGLKPDFIQKISDPHLQELNFGAWEGRPWSAIPHAQVDAWAADLPHYRPGGGESLAQMLQRVGQVLRTSWLRDSHQGQRHSVWVCHAGTIRCVQWLLQHGSALPSSAQWLLPAPAYGQWVALPWQQVQAWLMQTQKKPG